MKTSNFSRGEVVLKQTGFNRFTVVYHKQIKTGLDYVEAAHELGECLMHQLACEGRIDNRTLAEAQADGDRKPYFEVQA